MLLRELRRFFEDEGGTEVLEWAVVAFILLGFTVFVIIQLGTQLQTLMCGMLRSLGATQCNTGTTPQS